MAVNGRARRVSLDYFRKRFGLKGWKAWKAVFKNQRDFSKVVIDRFAMYAGHRFPIEIEGYDNFQRLSEGEKGFVQLSSHIGNYEIAGYSLVAENKCFNALVFGGEKESVMANRNKLFEGNNIRMIAMKEDMSHLFEIDKALTAGEILSMPADRVFGSQKAFSIPFLGEEAKFPQGPFMLAALRETPMLFVAVMKEGIGYRIFVKEVTPPEQGGERIPVKKRAEALAREYARLLEEIVKRYPTQWYNYFDFWA